jgi:hypothetical protein
MDSFLENRKISPQIPNSKSVSPTNMCMDPGGLKMEQQCIVSRLKKNPPINSPMDSRISKSSPTFSVEGKMMSPSSQRSKDFHTRHFL